MKGVFPACIRLGEGGGGGGERGRGGGRVKVNKLSRLPVSHENAVKV